MKRALLTAAVVLVLAALSASFFASDTPNPQLGSAPLANPVAVSGFPPPSVTTTTEVAVHAASASKRVVVGNVWDALAECESHGNWSTNTGNGYSGGLQMDAAFWSSYGGLEFAPEPWMATREQQIVVAERGHAARGFQPWPECSRRLGLR